MALKTGNGRAKIICTQKTPVPSHAIIVCMLDDLSNSDGYGIGVEDLARGTEGECGELLR